MPTRSIITAAVIAAAALAVPVGAATAARSEAHTGATKVFANCRKATYEPTRVITACGDAGEFVTIRHYDRWGQRAATGRGFLHVNACEPDCAHGTFERFPATLRFDDPVTNSHGVRVFRRLDVTVTDGDHTRHSRTILVTRQL